MALSNGKPLEIIDKLMFAISFNVRTFAPNLK